MINFNACFLFFVLKYVLLTPVLCTPMFHKFWFWFWHFSVLRVPHTAIFSDFSKIVNPTFYGIAFLCSILGHLYYYCKLIVYFPNTKEMTGRIRCLLWELERSSAKLCLLESIFILGARGKLSNNACHSRWSGRQCQTSAD